MSLEKLLKRSLLGLSTLIISCGSESDPEGAGCTSDQECKGDRLCVQGQCVTPENYENSIPTPNQVDSSDCQPNCGYDCSDNCSSLINDEFNVWNKDTWGNQICEKISSGYLIIEPSSCNGGLRLIRSNSTYGLGEFHQFVLNIRMKGQSSFFGFSIGNNEDDPGFHCMINSIFQDNEVELKYDPFKMICSKNYSGGTGKSVGGNLENSSEWHDYHLTWSKEGSVALSIDQVFQGSFDIPSISGNYHLTLYCETSIPAGGICSFDYVKWWRE